MRILWANDEGEPFPVIKDTSLATFADYPCNFEIDSFLAYSHLSTEPNRAADPLSPNHEHP